MPDSGRAFLFLSPFAFIVADVPNFGTSVEKKADFVTDVPETGTSVILMLVGGLGIILGNV